MPAEDDPQYELLADAAEGDLILSRWVLGEAEERGIEVTDREIDDELEAVKEEQFGSEKAFEKFLEQSGFTLEEAQRADQAAAGLRRDPAAVLPPDEPPEVTDAEVEAYYEENLAQFEQPETRDVRVILTETRPTPTRRSPQLGTRPDEKTWEKVAKKYSIDEATEVHRRPARGGRRRASPSRRSTRRSSPPPRASWSARSRATRAST